MASETNEPIADQCPECSGSVDVTQLSPFSEIICPHCNMTVRIRTVLGQYQIKRLLGEGGMSQVFAAEDLTLGRIVALKILHQALSQDSKLTAMFEREAKLTASINHPNVVKVYTVGSEHGYFYIAMELVDAVSVEEMITQQGAMPEAIVLKLAYDVVSGLKAAYQNNLIHRDIKPGNMLVTTAETTKLVDFGLAVAQGGADENEDLWATPFYVPPEKLVREPDTHLGDIYALGATCYHALAGQPPFYANTNSLEELIEIKSQPVDLKAVAPNARNTVISLIEKMMAYNPIDRPKTYDELLKSIAMCQQTLTGAAPTRTHATTPTAPAAKSKLPLILLAVLAVVGATGAGMIYLNNSQGVDDTSALEALLSNSGSRVITDADRRSIQKMITGRSALLQGDYSLAKSTFNEIDQASSSFAQPAKAWNLFSEGLVELFLNDEPSARVYFERLQSEKGFDDELAAYKQFFHHISPILSDKLPVLRADFTINENSFEVIALLTAGLKNWQQGQFKEAMLFFEEFKGQTIPSNEKWIQQMKPKLAAYEQDFLLFQKLPSPSAALPTEELEGIKTTLSTELAKLKTKGSLVNLIESRLQRTNDFLSATQVPTEPTKPRDPSEWTEAEKAEVQEIQKLVNSLSSYRNDFDFAEARSTMDDYQASTPVGQALRQDITEGYAAADLFLDEVIDRLNLQQYEGSVRRREGRELDAKITSANRDHFTVNLGFGPNEVELDKFAIEWLAKVGSSTLDDPSAVNIGEWKHVFWFANVCGETATANRIARKIIDFEPDFRDAGTRFRQVKFTKAGL